MKPPTLWAAHLGTDFALQPPVTSTMPDLKRTLESAVMMNWKDVMPDSPEGLIDVEYRIAADGSLEYLRLWACSRRGFWHLICQYSMFWKWSNTKTVSFGTGYQSKPLAERLDYIIQHEAQFSVIAEPGKTLVQVYPPSETQLKVANQYVSAFAA
jgi:hypothetical protein